MIPWKQQQIWFWLAAILIVTGASTLRDTTHQTVDSNNGLLKTKKSTSVIRSRAELSPDFQVKSSSEMTVPIQQVTFEEPVKTKSHPDLRELIVEQNEVVQADFSEQKNQHKDSATQVVQLSYEQIDSEQRDRPAVWLTGTIEAVEDTPRILPDN